MRRLAAIRKEDPQPLLALLWRDRMLYAFGKELRRVLHAPPGVAGIEDADLAVSISQAIAALPDDGGWITLAQLAEAVPDRAAPADARRRSDRGARQAGGRRLTATAS